MLLNEKIANFNYDGLVLGQEVEAATLIKIANGTGTLKRGSVVTGTPGDEFALAEAALADAVYIIADDVELGTGVVASAYVKGSFAKDKLIVAEGYALTAADFEFMRKSGIYAELAI